MHDVIYDRIRISGDARQSSFLLGRSPRKKPASVVDWYRGVFAHDAFLKSRSISRRRGKSTNRALLTTRTLRRRAREEEEARRSDVEMLDRDGNPYVCGCHRHHIGEN